MPQKKLAHARSAFIFTAASRAFDGSVPGAPPPALIIEGESPASGLLAARRALASLANVKGVALIENTAAAPLSPKQADAMEIFCASIFEPGSPAMKEHIKERLAAASGSAGFFLALHDADQASPEGQTLLRELLSKGSFDGQQAKAPLFIVTSSSTPFDLPKVHNALKVLRAMPPALPPLSQLAAEAKGAERAPILSPAARAQRAQAKAPAQELPSAKPPKAG